MMKRFFFVLLMGAAVFSAMANSPNLVVILADDLGWMDVNATAEVATGTPPEKQFYETPNLNALAKEGAFFSRCYSMPLCSPSRATFLTGRNGSMFGFNNASGMRRATWTYAIQKKTPPKDFLMTDRIPHAPAHYPVAVATENSALPNGLPDSRGLKLYTLPEMLPNYRSAFLGKWHLGGNNLEGHRPQDFGFEPITYEDEGGSKYGKGVRQKWHYPGPPAQADYLTDDLTALSVDWIRKHVEEQPKKPFLLYCAHFAVHSPIEAKPEDVAYFEEKKTRGWNGQNNAAYAAMVRALDDSVGTIRATLKKLRIEDDTIILFVSDNGARAVRTKNNPWTSNTPFRGQKGQTFEGGIRVPMFMYIPGGKGNGRQIDVPVAFQDFAPTLTALANQTVSEEIQNQWTGTSLIPLLENRPEDFAKRAIFIHEPYYRPDRLTEGEPLMPPSTVMIEGDYKLIAYHDGTMRLYDLSKDLGEQNDLSASMPERVETMKKRVMQWRVKNIPARYDTSANQKYNPESKEALPEPDGNLFVR
jgi:arylsulfatase A-like enzyme